MGANRIGGGVGKIGVKSCCLNGLTKLYERVIQMRIIFRNLQVLMNVFAKAIACSDFFVASHHLCGRWHQTWW